MAVKKTETNPLEDTSAEVVEIFSNQFSKIWNYALFTVENNSVTVGNIIVAVFLLFFGLWYLRIINNKLKSFLQVKFKQDKDAANAIQNLVSYSLLIILVTIVLQIAQIPIKAFAFIGGALAIGVGLGAQNLINNFISSLIILIERPVKIGDLIEIGAVKGIVVAVGSRCITIRTSNLSDVLIPNSKLIQENLSNWSLHSNLAKMTINLDFYKNALCRVSNQLSGSSIGSLEECKELCAKDIKSSIDGMSPEDIQKKLSEIFEAKLKKISDEEISVYFIGFDKDFLKFKITFVYNAKKLQEHSTLISELNLLLSQHFNLDDMIINYTY